jgi:integrase
MKSPLLTGRMTIEQQYAATLANTLRKIGPSDSVTRFLSKYGNVRTRAIYACELYLYLRWLNGKTRTLTPDELVHDNLVCVFKSEAVDVATKRKHTDWLNEYVNIDMIANGNSESKRRLAAATIKEFYKRNDALLYGDFSLAGQAPSPPLKALYPDDIRKVLLALPLRTRTPLLLSWQSGIEINRVLSNRFPIDQAPPVKIDLYGRKSHRRTYSTFIGGDSVGHLRMMNGQAFPQYHTVLYGLKDAARRLSAKGLLKNPELASWHPHALRHSFETEASHAGVKAEIRDFFLGHIGGIQWIYNHRDEVHPDDLIKEYSKIEPFVSLNPDETVTRERYSGREKELRSEVEVLRGLYEELKEAIQSSRNENPSQRSVG